VILPTVMLFIPVCSFMSVHNFYESHTYRCMPRRHRGMRHRVSFHNPVGVFSVAADPDPFEKLALLVPPSPPPSWVCCSLPIFALFSAFLFPKHRSSEYRSSSRSCGASSS
jgi:hypothetical protein